MLTPVVKRVMEECKARHLSVGRRQRADGVGQTETNPDAHGEMLEFIRGSPGVVLANHLEALNECPATHDEFRAAAAQAGLNAKTGVLRDGELLVY